jgi:pimeloyl-ACP methyl ester carboxylesterase
MLRRSLAGERDRVTGGDSVPKLKANGIEIYYELHGLRNITAPTLIVSGDDDPLVPPENSRILKEWMPHARLIFLKGKRHCFFIEEAETFNQQVISFLDSIGSQ